MKSTKAQRSDLEQAKRDLELSDCIRSIRSNRPDYDDGGELAVDVNLESITPNWQPVNLSAPVELNQQSGRLKPEIIDLSDGVEALVNQLMAELNHQSRQLYKDYLADQGSQMVDSILLANKRAPFLAINQVNRLRQAQLNQALKIVEGFLDASIKPITVNNYYMIVCRFPNNQTRSLSRLADGNNIRSMVDDYLKLWHQGRQLTTDDLIPLSTDVDTI